MTINPNHSFIYIHSRGMSDEKWLQTGIKDREEKYLATLSKQLGLNKILCLSYGDSTTVSIVDTVSITHLPLPPILQFKSSIIRQIAAFIFFSLYLCLKISSSKNLIIRSGQSDGSYLAWLSKIIFPNDVIFVVRFGYNQEYLLRSKPPTIILSLKIIISRLVADVSSVLSDYCIFPSPYLIPSSFLKKPKLMKKCIIQPTYVYSKDTETLTCSKDPKFIKGVYLGRVAIEKGLVELNYLVSHLNISVDLYGFIETGMHRYNLNNTNVLGPISSSHIFEILNTYTYGFHLSRSEGFPKSIFEMHLAKIRVVCVYHNCFKLLDIPRTSYEFFTVPPNYDINSPLLISKIKEWMCLNEEFTLLESILSLELSKACAIESNSLLNHLGIM